jgi:primosomal protein N'
MWIVSALPLGKVAAHKEFSYFSLHEHQEGALVEIPSRGKKQFGLVMKSTDVQENRQEIKSAGFNLKKIAKPSRRIVRRSFLRAAFDIAQYHACSAGAVISELVPQTILENVQTLPQIEFSIPQSLVQEPTPLVGTRADRFENYIKIAQSAHASKTSVLIITPTIVEAQRLEKFLTSRGLNAAIIHGSLSKKILKTTWQQVATSPEPLVIVGTALALSCPRRDISTIILERAGARGIHRSTRPFLNIEVCAKICAQQFGARFIIASPAPLIGKPPSSKYSSAHNISIIDMRPPKRPDVPNPPKKIFTLFSFDAISAITETLPQRGVLLLCARRGLATQTVCDDCGSTFTCQRCGSAFILQNTPREFVCPYCDARAPATTTCRTCGSWRLRPLGIGLDRVAEDAKALFSHARIIAADERTLLRPAQALLAGSALLERNTLLISTEGILPFLDEVPLAVVVSLDSLLYLPEYTASEFAFQSLSEIAGVSSKLMIQTRVPQHPLLLELQSRDGTFLKRESALREKFLYPPKTTLIRIIGPYLKKEDKELFQKNLSPYSPVPLAIKTKKGLQQSLLLRLPEASWPDTKLVSMLRALSPAFEIRINPPALLSQ